MYSLTTEEKEVKDMSKNLVSGDFEREYRDGMLEKPHRQRRVVQTFLVISVSVLACWLVALTVVREVQLSRLRHQTEELSADVLAMKMTIHALNQKLQNKRIADSIFYEDIDEGNIPVEDEKVPTEDHNEPSNDSLGKLRDVTVLETVIDDEDMYDDDEDDDGESGDWYSDYDKRSEKIGKSSMVRLKPEDFSDSLIKLRADASPLWEIKKMLNEDPQNPAVFAAATNSQLTDIKDRKKRSIAAESGADFVDQFAAPRSISKTDERRKNKKYRSPSKVEVPQAAKLSASKYPNRIARQSEDAEGVRRPFIAAHFHGNTSHLNIESHEHYKGNGLLRVPHESHHDVWYPSPWTMSSPHPRPTLTRGGHVRVHHTGVYLVYVQIYYLDSHDTISWVLHRTNPDTEGRDKLLQCAQYSTHSQNIDRPNSCFSAAALLLRAGDRLVVRNTEGDRHSLMQPEKSFIGLVKLADAEDPEEEQF